MCGMIPVDKYKQKREKYILNTLCLYFIILTLYSNKCIIFVL